MEKKFLLGNYLILWVILLFGQLNGCKSCIDKEKNALLELQAYMVSMSGEEYVDYVLPSWSHENKSDCCGWEGVECSHTSGRVTEITITEGLSIFQANSYLNLSSLKANFLLNLSLLHPFEELRSLNLSVNYFSGFFDDSEGYKSLRKLKKLEILDLSRNNFSSNNIFPFLNAAISLKSLSLGYNHMEGSIPAKALKDLINLELLDLSVNRLNGSMSGLEDLINLELLDLSYNKFNGSSMPDFTHLTKLKSLDLSHNGFSSSMQLQPLRDLTNLEVLNLSRNRLNGSISVFTHLKKLKALDLSKNDYSSTMELQDLKELINLEFLNLEGSRSNGSMSVFCEMKNLKELNFDGSKLMGQLPLCLGYLKRLQVLEISDNLFSGDLPSSFNCLESLQYLSLLDNNFIGLMSLNPLMNLTRLKVLKLSSRSDMVQVDVESILQPTFQLSVLVLRSCGLEKIPSFLIDQKRLRLVDLSQNKLSKNIPTWLLVNNPELEVLKLQKNLFTRFQMPAIVHHNLKVLNFSANEIGGLFPDSVFPNMLDMDISNNGFQGSFPFSEMKKIQFMDLSYNAFSGKLPRSFLKDCLSLQYLKLSHNKFEGNFLTRGINITSLVALSINNNLFKGKIGVELLTLRALLILDISNNFFTGDIPRWMSNMSLSYLDLSGNLLSGVLPSRVSNSHWDINLKVFLHNNNLIGPIPDTFLENVEILDLRNNNISGNVPLFVNTDEIKILLLRGNNLKGSIPRQLCDWRNIQLLDLSDNKLSGFIPTCLYNLSFGNEGENMYSLFGETYFPDDYYIEFYRSALLVEELLISNSINQEIEIKFAAKQRYESYTGSSQFSKGILSYMYGMDFSNNELSGGIPEELGYLLKVLTLNLSRNLLSGSIPSSFYNLKDIESLDLSYNKLHGRIPQQLTSLTFLAVFNVSYNNLSRIIPQGKQFNTFNENSYLGNSLLCGLPTNRSCEAMKRSKEEDNSVGENEDDEASIDMLVFYYSSASSYATVLIGILVLLCIYCPWRRAWFRVIDGFIASVKSMLC